MGFDEQPDMGCRDCEEYERERLRLEAKVTELEAERATGWVLSEAEAAELRDRHQAALARVSKLELALGEIGHGLITQENGGPSMDGVSPAEFRHQMWTWSQKMARRALGEEA